MGVATGVCNFLGSKGIWGIAWDGWSALATAVAAIIALSVPWWMSRREWKRQDRLRLDARIDAIREVCSAVDQILAYHEIALALARAGFPFLPAQQSFGRIRENVTTLSEMLHILQGRSELTDGAVFSAVAIQRIAAPLIECVTAPETVADWATPAAKLDALSPLAALIQIRVDGVRRYIGLNASTSAQSIRAKYQPAIAEMARALAAQEVPQTADILADRF